jgi:hypothetical protein
MVGEVVGVDLWDYRSGDGRSLYAALNYIAPYADPSRSWMKNDIEAADRQSIVALLSEAYRISRKALETKASSLTHALSIDPSYYRSLAVTHMTQETREELWNLWSEIHPTTEASDYSCHGLLCF